MIYIHARTSRIIAAAFVSAIASACFLVGCGHPVQRAPALAPAADAPTAPPQKPLLEKAADTTWNVVSAPVRWVTPSKKPAAAPKEPEHYESVDAMIIAPGGAPFQPPASATPEKTAAPPATRP